MEVGSLPLVQLLVEQGADLTATADLYDGDTALQLARRLKQDGVVDYLS